MKQNLVKRFEGEFPKRYFSDVINHLEIDEKKFLNCVTISVHHIFGKKLAKEIGN